MILVNLLPVPKPKSLPAGMSSDDYERWRRSAAFRPCECSGCSPREALAWIAWRARREEAARAVDVVEELVAAAEAVAE